MNRAMPERPGMFDRLRNSVESGWNRLRDRARDFGERWDNGTIRVETAAEVLTIANSAIDRVNNIGDRWENSGSNFSERLRNSIHQAGENIAQSYTRISRNIGERVQNFRQDVEDYSLGDAIGNRIHEAMINVQDMVVDATDFVSELPLRSRIAKNTICW